MILCEILGTCELRDEAITIGSAITVRVKCGEWMIENHELTTNKIAMNTAIETVAYKIKNLFL